MKFAALNYFMNENLNRNVSHCACEFSANDAKSEMGKIKCISARAYN